VGELDRKGEKSNHNTESKGMKRGRDGRESEQKKEGRRERRIGSAICPQIKFFAPENLRPDAAMGKLKESF